MAAARQRPEDQDLYLDPAALSLHDFCAGLERIFRQSVSSYSLIPGQSRNPACSKWLSKANTSSRDRDWSIERAGRRSESERLDAPLLW